MMYEEIMHLGNEIFQTIYFGQFEIIGGCFEEIKNTLLYLASFQVGQAGILMAYVYTAVRFYRFTTDESYVANRMFRMFQRTLFLLISPVLMGALVVPVVMGMFVFFGTVIGVVGALCLWIPGVIVATIEIPVRLAVEMLFGLV